MMVKEKEFCERWPHVAGLTLDARKRMRVRICAYLHKVCSACERAGLRASKLRLRGILCVHATATRLDAIEASLRLGAT